jgi:hypothetical protein
MTYSPLSLSRRHVLGDLYARCDSLTDSVPVYLAGQEPELLGQVDEGLGHYADAYCFHLADDVCKKLSAGQFTYSFDFDYSDPANTGSRGRISLKAITLNARKAYEKPVSKALA